MTSGRLSEKINRAYADETPRAYRSSRIGASSIGDPCEAYLALSLRGFPDSAPDPRLKRIFRDGHKLEPIVIADIRKAGYQVQEKDPLTGGQYMWDKYGGHVCYYADGLIEIDGETLLLEVKSMNHALWTSFKNKGVKFSHKHYYQQLQAGMGLSGFRKAVIIGYNKDKSEYWDEEVQFDDIEYHALIHKAERALMGHAARVATDETDWRCRACFKCDSCWGKVKPVADMRTCANARPMPTGGWTCDKGCTTKCESYIQFEPTEKTK